MTAYRVTNLREASRLSRLLTLGLVERRCIECDHRFLQPKDEAQRQRCRTCAPQPSSTKTTPSTN